ncbi:MAG: translation initiation factor IF-2 [Clostridia bacterium]|nr:translation initiation factor IF-2 [Clostridia bacterium]
MSDLAKDLDVKAKDISDILTASGYGQKNRMAVLSPAEFEIVMNTFTLKNKTDDLEKYLSGEITITVPEKKAPAPKKEKPAAEKKPSDGSEKSSDEKAPAPEAKPADEAPDKPAQEKQTPAPEISKPAEQSPEVKKPEEKPSDDKKPEAAPAAEQTAPPKKEEPKAEAPAAAQPAQKPAAPQKPVSAQPQQIQRPAQPVQPQQPKKERPPEKQPEKRRSISIQPPQPKTTSVTSNGAVRQNMLKAEDEAKKAAALEREKQRQLAAAQAAAAKRSGQNAAAAKQGQNAQQKAQKQGWVNGPQRDKNGKPIQPQNGQQKPKDQQAQQQAQQKQQAQKDQRQSAEQKQGQNAAAKAAPTGKKTDRAAEEAKARSARFENKPNFEAQKQAQQKKGDKKQERDRTKAGVIIPTPTGGQESTTVVVSEGSDSARMKSAKVVDTRGGGSVDLSKYDERLDTLVPVSNKKNENTSSKQKLKKGGREERSDRRDNRNKKPQNPPKKQQLEVTLPDEIVVNELAMRLHVTVAEVIKKLVMQGVMASANMTVDFDTAGLVAMEFGAKVEKEVVVTLEEKILAQAEQPDDPDDLVERPPVVVVMGHVDHGKTSLLDAIRNTHVTAGEAGGITQSIGAYQVNIKGKNITFLDTPGHEAFTAMRARGAMATDIAVLVVAADDGIMPQTVEAINHAKAAGVDIIVAINKMDKHGANPQKVMEGLTKYDLVPEEWGGDVICDPVSAVTKQGIDKLLEDILLVAEVRELKANPKRKAKGIVIEARLDKGLGPVSSVLVQNGTLRQGDTVLAGMAIGRVRTMRDEKGRTMKEAGPSVPAEIIGLDEVPVSGDEFIVVEDEKMARELTAQRREQMREEGFKQSPKASLDELFDAADGEKKSLNIIIKGDVVGSCEAVRQSLEKLSNDEVELRVIHTAVGGITENDVMLASASSAIIVGFSVRPDRSATESAERSGVEIRTYQIIYEMIDEIEKAMKGLLAPTFKENVLGHAEVRQTIHVSSVGTVAGSYVTDGKIARSGQVRVLRDSVVIFDDKISSLRRFKDDVREVQQGYECGIALEKFNDIKVGDVLECYEMKQVEEE